MVSGGYSSQEQASSAVRAISAHHNGCPNPEIKIELPPDPNEGFFEKAIRYAREQDTGD